MLAIFHMFLSSAMRQFFFILLIVVVALVVAIFPFSALHFKCFSLELCVVWLSLCLCGS